MSEKLKSILITAGIVGASAAVAFLGEQAKLIEGYGPAITAGLAILGKVLQKYLEKEVASEESE